MDLTMSLAIVEKNMYRSSIYISSNRENIFHSILNCQFIFIYFIILYIAIRNSKQLF